MNKPFSEKFMDVIELSGDKIEGCTALPKERFVGILEEEIQNFGVDTQAEVGMGFYRVIDQNRKRGKTDTEIVDMMIEICSKLIALSPESAHQLCSYLKGTYSNGIQ